MCRSKKEKTACSGRCASDCQPFRTWIVAACDGCIILLDRDEKQLNAVQGGKTFATATEFSSYLIDKQSTFHQLILVGSQNDIAWAGTIIPASLNTRITAELSYPLVKAWFHEPSLKHLREAIIPLMQ